MPRDLGVHGQGQDVGGGSFRRRDSIPAIIGEGGSMVNRSGIVNSRLYSRLFQISFQSIPIALLQPNHVQVVDTERAVRGRRSHNTRDRAEQLVVMIRMLPPQLIPLFQVSEL